MDKPRDTEILTKSITDVDSEPKRSRKDIDDTTSIKTHGSSFAKGEVLSLETGDPVLKAKLHLVNDVSLLGLQTPQKIRKNCTEARLCMHRLSIKSAGQATTGSCSS